MKRREFLRTSLTASTVAGLGVAGLNVSAQSDAGSGRDYYELRIYRLKAGASSERLDGYLENAAIPAWNRLGIKPIGVFTEKEPKDAPAVYVLIPYPSMNAFSDAVAKLMADPELQKAGANYLQAPKADPAFDRIDSWFMLAFAGMPKLEQPAFSRERKPRVFELRTYESHSEMKALKKVEMFNSGEIELMHQVNLGPIFYGQVLVGSNLPHLKYMLSAEDLESHKKHFADFGKSPIWKKMSGDPQYADTVSKVSSQFLVPTNYSQI